ncbi:conserved hypothetical protein [Anaeromyxobacter dehalogenans 2CP-1]|uniref:Uncharacterized protein n=1 Tax=Anaeromyxobacter dehalogenans (strain ATCC BAA-258 / DSM 21875 / 2CP-1) TaxID=455488 RepID=B8JBF5_ANAD2|nr:hypothetical protein [Anaeromyxobacter dehalogenans]ACL65782.1 conserved hypothetical protein [Anaeromyxobacter dehalogenans 2CP-1]
MPLAPLAALALALAAAPGPAPTTAPKPASTPASARAPASGGAAAGPVVLEVTADRGVAAAIVGAVTERLCAAVAEAARADAICPDGAPELDVVARAEALGACQGEDCPRTVGEALEAGRRVLARLERDASGGLRITVRLLGAAGVPVASAAAPLPEDVEPLLARAASLVPGLFEARGAGAR